MGARQRAVMRPSTRSKHNRQRATEDHHVHAPQSRLSYLTMVLYFWKDRRSHSRNRAYTKTCYQTPKIQVRCFKYTRFKSACSKKLDQTQLRTSWSYPTATEHKAGHDAITGHASEVGSWDGAINSCVPRHKRSTPAPDGRQAAVAWHGSRSQEAGRAAEATKDPGRTGHYPPPNCAIA